MKDDQYFVLTLVLLFFVIMVAGVIPLLLGY
jgi:hypothetical protein